MTITTEPSYERWKMMTPEEASSHNGYVSITSNVCPYANARRPKATQMQSDERNSLSVTLLLEADHQDSSQNEILEETHVFKYIL